MDSLSNAKKTTSGRRRSAGNPAEATKDGLARTSPRSRAVNRSERADEFGAFAEEILRDLNPRGPLQRLAADHVVHSAWRLKGGLEKRAARESGEKSDPDAQASKVRSRPTELDLSSRSLKEAVETFDLLAHRASLVANVAVDLPRFVPDFVEPETDIFPNEWPIVPSEIPDELPGGLEASDDEVPSWRDRLVYDFDVSDISPVVKGTWVTVSHVVSLIVDGWTWADILRSHPELAEEDIRICVAYAMDEENTAP